MMTKQYKQYRVANNKGPLGDFENGSRRSRNLKDRLNRKTPFTPHWVEYRLVDEFKIPRRPELVKPLNGKKDSSLCCRCFYLPASPEEIEIAYSTHTGWLEIDKIAPMLIHLKYQIKNPLCINQNNIEKANYYTCKHLNRESGACLIYDNGRPELCKSFPEFKGELVMCDHCTTKETCNGVKAYEERMKQCDNLDNLRATLTELSETLKG